MPRWLTLRQHQLDLRRPQVMGIVNVTPDSFSDGGLYASHQAAIEHGILLAKQGADIIDVGGESTRPGAEPLDAAQECERVVPVVRALAERGLCVSIDSTKAVVAEEALKAGASMVNDVGTGESLARLGAVAAKYRAGYLRMHSRGTPATMQSQVSYERGVVTEVCEALQCDAMELHGLGIPSDAIVVDPGIGFAKVAEDSLSLIAHTATMLRMGWTVCVGPSRKSFITAKSSYALGWRDAQDPPPQERIGGTAAAVTAAILAGAQMIRVHDVAIMTQAARIAFALRAAQAGGRDA